MHTGKMGRLFAVILVLAACSDSQPVVGTNAPTAGDNGPPASVGTPTPRLEPSVCSARSWTGAPIPALDADLAIAGDVTHVAIVATPRAGGAAVGFTLDRGMSVVTSSTKLALGVPLSSIALAKLGGPYVTAGVDTASATPVVLVDGFGPDLTPEVGLAKIAGGIVAKPAVVSVGRMSIVPVGGAGGVTFAELGGARLTGEMKITTAQPVTGLTATPFAGDALVAWSTATTCSLAQLADLTPGPVSQVAAPCATPRLAADPASGTEALVYTEGDAVLLRYFAGNQLARAPEVLRSQARAPRVAFDGTRYWVSYIDIRGDVVAGFVDHGGNLVSTALTGTQPQADAYELVMLSGAPWVVSLDANGYSAQELCAVPAS